MGVPSHFTSHHKTAVRYNGEEEGGRGGYKVMLCRRCCEDAGFEVMRVITEATAVCLAHSELLCRTVVMIFIGW